MTSSPPRRIDRFVSGAFWLSFASILARLSGLITISFLARQLGPAGVGIYNVFFTAGQSGQALSTLGVDIATHRAGAQIETMGRRHTGEVFAAGLLVSAASAIAVAFLLLLWRGSIAEGLYGQADLAPWLGYSALVIALFPFSNLPLLFLASLNEFKSYSVQTTTVTIVGSAIVATGAFVGGVAGAVTASVAVAAVQLPWTWMLARGAFKRRGASLHFTNLQSHAKALLKTGVPYYLGNTLAGSIVGVILLGLVARQTGLEDLGYLRVAQSLSALTGLIPNAVAPVALTSLSALAVLPDQAQAHRFKSTYLKLMTGLLLIVTVGAMPLLSSVVPAVFGEEYRSAIALSAVLLLSNMLNGVNAVLVQYLLILGKSWRIAAASSIGTAGVLVSAWLLIPTFGAMGYVLGFAVGFTIGFAIVVRPAIAGIPREHRRQHAALVVIAIALSLIGFATTLVTLSAVAGVLLSIAIMAITAASLYAFVATAEERALLKRYRTVDSLRMLTKSG